MTIEEVKEFAITAHDHIRQPYGSRNHLSYGFHLELAAKIAEWFSSEVELNRVVARKAVYLHDILEDHYAYSYNDLKELFGVEVAEVVFLVTDFKGRTRKERHCNQYFTEIAASKEATFVKLCDLTANVLYSIYSNSSMFEMYKKEYSNVFRFLYKDEFSEIFSFLDRLFEKKGLSDEWVSCIEQLEVEYVLDTD